MLQRFSMFQYKIRCLHVKQVDSFSQLYMFEYCFCHTVHKTAFSAFCLKRVNFTIAHFIYRVSELHSNYLFKSLSSAEAPVSKHQRKKPRALIFPLPSLRAPRVYFSQGATVGGLCGGESVQVQILPSFRSNKHMMVPLCERITKLFNYPSYNVKIVQLKFALNDDYNRFSGK